MTVQARVWTQMRLSPQEAVYSKAAWMVIIELGLRTSTWSSSTVQAVSLVTLGSASRSVPRMKKLPWKLVTRRPLVARTRMTDSKPVLRVRSWTMSALKRSASRASLKAAYCSVEEGERSVSTRVQWGREGESG